jgi:hypothetical protein
MTQEPRGIRKLSAVAAGVIGVSLALTACANGGGKSTGGTSKLPPQQAVATAVKNLGQQSSLQTTASLAVSQAQAEQLKDSSGSKPSPAEAKALSTGSIFVTEATGHGEPLDSTQAKTDHQNSYAFGLSFGHDVPLEIRYVDQNLYVHAEVPQLLADLGQPSADANKFNSTLAQADTFVPGLAALGQGKWVEVTQASLQSLSALLKQAAGSTSANSSQLQADILKLRTQVLSAVQANSTFTRVGSSNGRDGYSVTVNLSGLVNTITPEVQSTLSNIPGFSSGASGAFHQAKGQVPAGKTAVIDVYVASDKVSEADLDLNQFNKDFSSPVPLRLTFSGPGAPSAPSGATTLNLSKLPALLGGLLGDLGHRSSSSSSSSRTTTSADA